LTAMPVLWAILIAAALLLGGCGYQLRDSAELPASYQRLYVENLTADDPLYRALAHALRHGSTRLVRHPAEATARVVIERNELVDRVAVVDPRAQAREYELTQTVDFYVVTSEGGRLPSRTLTASRQYGYDPVGVLASAGNAQQTQWELAETIARLIHYRLLAEPPARSDTP